MLKNNASLKFAAKPSRYAFALLIFISCILSACANSPKSQQAVLVQNKSIETNTSYNQSAVVISQDEKNKRIGNKIESRIENSNSSDSRADELIQRSTKVPANVKATMQLRAAELYIEENKSTTAEQVVNLIDIAQLSPEQISQYTVLKAKSFVNAGQYKTALNALAKVNFDDLRTSQYQAEYLLNVSRALMGAVNTQNQSAKIKSTSNALDALLKREAYLFNELQLSQNRNELWQITDTLSNEEIDNIYATTNSEFLKNWLDNSRSKRAQTTSTSSFEENSIEPSQITEPSIISETNTVQTPINNSVSETYASEQVTQPVENYGLQPEAVTGSNSIPSIWQANSPKRIALLLPLNSRFSNAARAFENGFKAAHRQNNTQNKPNIKVYNIDNSGHVLDVVQQSIAEGADYIVGPLGRQNAQLVLDNSYTNVPTLALGGAITSPNSNQSVFTLSPEQEAFAIAQHAINNGHFRAAILSPSTTKGERIKAAFESGIQAFGGSVVSSMTYATGQFDHGSEIKQLLSINASESRHKALSSTLGFRPKFTPSRRSDVDFLLLVGNPASARVIKPQLSFYQAHSLPTYATSDVFSGNIDVANDADLDNIIFPEMPSVLNQLNAGEQNISGSSRLHSFGYDSYNLVPIITDLKNYSGTKYSGLTGQLSVNSRGEIMRLPGWAKFENGLPTLIESYNTGEINNVSGSTHYTQVGSQHTGNLGNPPTSTNSPSLDANNESTTVINRSNRYDSKTWNPRKNRRAESP